MLSTYAKQRREAIDSYEQGGREDLAAKERAELAIIEEYLPAQLGEEQIAEIVRAAIAECGATSPRDMARVVGHLLPGPGGYTDRLGAGRRGNTANTARQSEVYRRGGVRRGGQGRQKGTRDCRAF